MFFLLPVTKLATSDVENTEQPTTPRPRESAQTTSSMQQAAHSVQHATASQHTTYNSIQRTTAYNAQCAMYNSMHTTTDMVRWKRCIATLHTVVQQECSHCASFRSASRFSSVRS